MARIAGVDIPRDKRVEISLCYIYGIGLTTSRKILERTRISPDTRVKDLTEEEVNRLREVIDREVAQWVRSRCRRERQEGDPHERHDKTPGRDHRSASSACLARGA